MAITQSIKPELVLSRDVYSKEKFRNVKEFSSVMKENPWLTEVAIHLGYSSQEFGSMNFPMLFATQGSGNVKTIPAGHYDFKYPIIGRPKKSSKIANNPYGAADKPGIGNTTFTLFFEDNWFNNQSQLYKRYSDKLILLRVQGEPERVGNYYRYKVSMWHEDPTAFVPLSVLTDGTVWAEGLAKVPQEDSYGTTSKSYYPGKATNSLSLVRHGMKFKGNVNNVVMVYTIKANGKTFQTFVDWDYFLAELSFNEQCEIDLWTSKLGKNATGDLYMVDENSGLTITSGAGIDEQIVNKDTYSFLTYNKFFDLINELTFNRGGGGNYVIYTGRGGMIDLDRMLKNESLQLSAISTGALNDKIVTGSGYNMVFGAYFKSFRTVNQDYVTFVEHPMFNRGILGESSDLHPVTGFPLSSHDFYFMDMSMKETSNGSTPNILYVQEEGREYSQFTVSGASYVSKFGNPGTSRAHARDNSEVHGMKSQGVQILDPSQCFKLKCIAS